MTPEQMDRLYSYCLLSGKILFGLLTVTLFYPYTKFVLLNLMKNHRYAFSHPIAFGKRQTLLDKFLWFVVTPFLLITLALFIVLFIMVYFQPLLSPRGAFLLPEQTPTKQTPYKMLSVSQTAPKTPMTYHPRPFPRQNHTLRMAYKSHHARDFLFSQKEHNQKKLRDPLDRK